jgi:hypothetical protein
VTDELVLDHLLPGVLCLEYWVVSVDEFLGLYSDFGGHVCLLQLNLTLIRVVFVHHFTGGCSKRSILRRDYLSIALMLELLAAMILPKYYLRCDSLVSVGCITFP